VTLYRDPRALWALLLVPVGTLLLVGYVMRTAERGQTVALVVAGDAWPTVHAVSFIEESLEADDVATFRASSADAAEKAIRDGRAEAFVVIDDAFARGVLGGEQQTVVVGVAGDDLGRQGDLMRALGHALTTAPLKVFRSATGADPLPAEGPVEFDTTYIYGGEDYDDLDHVFPALLAFVAFFSILTVTLVGLTRERILHTIERLMATALRRSEFMLGYMLGYGAAAMAQVAAILLVAVFVLRVHHTGNLGVIFLLTLATSLGALNLGLLLSAFARTEQQAMQMLPLALVPQFVLSGLLFPLDSLPRALEVIARFMPMTYSVSALRDVMIRDHGLFDAGVATDLAVLLAFAAFFVVLGVRTLRREVT
jgi:ABC-2 type transport system permease protein